MSELLGQTTLDKSQTDYLSAINSSSKSLLVLINDVLDFSKIDSGNLSLEMIEFDLSKMINKTTEIISLKADNKGVDIRTSIDIRLPKILIGDPTRLGQVMLNLLTNAVKFTINNSVYISANLIKNEDRNYIIEFIVKDEGIGIPENELTNIFKDFTQAEDSTSRVYGGTGLGLSISQKIVHLMDGELKVRSELNKGSEFFFTIELEGSESNSIENEPDEINELKTDFMQRHILLVEDNKINSFMATTIMEKWNCLVHVAENGIEAIEKLKLQTYNLILMDLNMPKMGGIEASKIIRNKLNIKTPIIALTANAIKGDDQKCLDAGMNDYLSKPYHQIDLNKVLTKWLEISEDSNQEKLIDLTKLEDMNNPQFLDKMINLFIVEMGKNIVILNLAIKESDYKQITKIAHKIKPSLGFVCIPRLFETARTIEKWEESDDILINKTHLFIKDFQLAIEQLKQIK